jgi:hypothetical protein
MVVQDVRERRTGAHQVQRRERVRDWAAIMASATRFDLRSGRPGRSGIVSAESGMPDNGDNPSLSLSLSHSVVTHSSPNICCSLVLSGCSTGAASTSTSGGVTVVGFSGVETSGVSRRSLWLHSCVAYSVEPKWGPN